MPVIVFTLLTNGLSDMIYPYVDIVVNNFQDESFYDYEHRLIFILSYEEYYHSLAAQVVDGKFQILLDFGNDHFDRWEMENPNKEELNIFTHKELLKMLGYFECIRVSKKALTVEDIVDKLFPMLRKLYDDTIGFVEIDYEELIKEDMHCEEISYYTNRGRNNI